MALVLLFLSCIGERKLEDKHVSKLDLVTAPSSSGWLGAESDTNFIDGTERGVSIDEEELSSTNVKCGRVALLPLRMMNSVASDFFVFPNRTSARARNSVRDTCANH